MEKSAALVSVVVPTHERAGLLQETLATILAQSWPNLEVLVSDDGSTRTDYTSLPVMADRRVRLLRSPEPRGVSAARNRGIAAASGDYVAFCDDDDLWTADKLERQIDALVSTGAAWCYTSAVSVIGPRLSPGPRSDGPTRVSAEALREHNVVPGGGSAVMVRRETLSRSGVFDTAFSQFADWDMWLRLAQIGDGVTTGHVGTLYREHDAQMSADFSRMEDELERFRDKHGCQDRPPGHAGLRPMERYIFHRMRRAGAWRSALAYLRRTADPRLHRSTVVALVKLLAHQLGVRGLTSFDRELRQITTDVRATVERGCLVDPRE